MASQTVPEPIPVEARDAAELRAALFAAKAAWHAAQASRPPVEKVALLLRMQRELLPILRGRRPLARHERPWPIEP